MKGSTALEGYLDAISSQWKQAGSYGDGTAGWFAGRRGHDLPAGGFRRARRGGGAGRERCRPTHRRTRLPWTIFDRNLVEKVLEDHDLPARLAASMPEDRKSEMADTLDGLFGQRTTSWTLVKKTAETILHLAEVGNVVIIGRGANIITAKLPFAFHVRLVGSLERRIEHLIDYKHLSLEEAKEYARTEELGRARYVKKYYSADIEDPLLYDLVINTDRVSVRGGGPADRRRAVGATLAACPSTRSAVLRAVASLSAQV